jgi:group I intron endonuclease
VFKSDIYIIRNIDTNKVYIGSSKDIKNHWRQHKYDLKNNKPGFSKLQNSVNKHEIDNFNFKVLLYYNIIDLVFFEHRASNNYDSYKNGYTCKPLANTNLGNKRSVETKLKQSIAKLNKPGRKHREDSKKKLSLAYKGKQHKLGWKTPNEVKQKISISSKNTEVLKKSGA